MHVFVGFFWFLDACFVQAVDYLGRFVFEMMYHVSSGTLNLTNKLTSARPAVIFPAHETVPFSVSDFHCFQPDTSLCCKIVDMEPVFCAV